MTTFLEVQRVHSATGAFGGTVSGATVATPSVITCTAAHNLITGDQVQTTGIVGTTTDNTLAYALVISPTTFSIWSDAATSASPIAGAGTYSSGGVVTKAQDISGLQGDFTLHLNANVTASKNALIAVQDSADGFVNDIVTLWETNVQGGQGSGFYVPPQGFSMRAYQLPSMRMGVANARLRLFVTKIDAGATALTALWIEQ
jgi:hypothetical protein